MPEIEVKTWKLDAEICYFEPSFAFGSFDETQKIRVISDRPGGDAALISNTWSPSEQDELANVLSAAFELLQGCRIAAELIDRGSYEYKYISEAIAKADRRHLPLASE